MNNTRSCPGIYTACGGELKLVRPHNPAVPAFWGCAKWPACNFRYFPPDYVHHAQLSLDVVSGDEFKVRLGRRAEGVSG